MMLISYFDILPQPFSAPTRKLKNKIHIYFFIYYKKRGKKKVY